MVVVVGAVVVAAVTGKQEVGQMVAAVVRRVKWVTRRWGWQQWQQ